MVVISRDISDMRNTEKRLLHAIFEGQEIERRRLSSDLHDGLGQYISALGFSMYRLEQDCKKLNIAKPDKALRDVQALITRAGQELKSVTYNLSPQHLEQYGLLVAARDYCRQIATLYGIKVSFRTRNVKDRLTPDLEIALYRLLQELLNNIIKHAAAKRAEVSIVKAGPLLMLSVSDDGNGIKSAHKKNGLGLQNIASRIRSYNGKIIINTKTGKGTGVTISIPVKQV
jgi:signal transduction histidine kinase